VGVKRGALTDAIIEAIDAWLGSKGEKEMSEKVIPDSTLDQAKRLRNGCTKISEERYQQSLKCIESNLH
jgi:hypothetical protein